MYIFYYWLLFGNYAQNVMRLFLSMFNALQGYLPRNKKPTTPTVLIKLVIRGTLLCSQRKAEILKLQLKRFNHNGLRGFSLYNLLIKMEPCAIYMYIYAYSQNDSVSCNYNCMVIEQPRF